MTTLLVFHPSTPLNVHACPDPLCLHELTPSTQSFKYSLPVARLAPVPPPMCQTSGGRGLALPPPRRCRCRCRCPHSCCMHWGVTLLLRGSPWRSTAYEKDCRDDIPPPQLLQRPACCQHAAPPDHRLGGPSFRATALPGHLPPSTPGAARGTRRAWAGLAQPAAWAVKTRTARSGLQRAQPCSPCSDSRRARSAVPDALWHAARPGAGPP